MLTKEKLEERCNYIGGSDAAAVLGLSRWGTPLSIWSEKTKAIPISEEQTLPQWWGSKSEANVAERFTLETSKKVRRVNETIYHKKYSFIAANIDRKIEGEEAILECKTAAVWHRKEWETDEIPPEYLIQVYHQLACTKHKKAYLACMIGNSKFVIREVLYDQHIIDNLISKEVYFWKEYVEKKVMPAQISIQDNDILAQLFPVPEPESFIELDDEVNVICEDIEAMEQDKRSLEGKIGQKKNVLKSILKDNEAGSTGQWQVTWKKGHKDSYVVPEWNGRTLRYKRIKEEE